MCGIVGTIRRGEQALPHLKPAELTIHALEALQHRGEEASGLAAKVASGIRSLRNGGLVAELSDRHAAYPFDDSITATIGHTRYSTSGAKGHFPNNTQPLIHASRYGDIGLVHNGNIPDLANDTGLSDSHQIITALATSSEPTFDQAVVSVCRNLNGSFSLIILNEDSIYLCRDRLGIRPLVYGRTPELTVVASEDCALKAVGATEIQSVKPGQILRLGRNKITPLTKSENTLGRACMLELAYFARPDSAIDKLPIAPFRFRCGKRLAKDAPPPKKGIIVPVVDAALHAATGYAKQAGQSLVFALMRNRGARRTFILPNHDQIAEAIRKKHLVIDSLVQGKIIVLVDDSIVRGNTTRVLVEMIRRAGAREVHLRIATPPIKYPCNLGMDFSDQTSLVAHNRTVEQVRRQLNADSLAYLSLPAFRKIAGHSLTSNPGCYACVTGHQPKL